MFASWSKTRKASLAVAALAAVGLVTAPSVHALEGIQGRHAIFYPSLELVYQHDDNYFLTPSDEVSADTWIAHAHFALEVPGARQYLRLEYAPQYRNVNVSEGNFDLDNDISHFWTLDAALKGSAVFGVDVHHDFTLGSLETYDLDENRGEIIRGAGEQWWSNHIDVDFNWEGSRQGATLRVGHWKTQFDDIDRAPAWFEIDQTKFGAEYFYKFTPLSQFLVGFLYRDNNQDYTTKARVALDLNDASSDQFDFYLGFNGELGRTTTGRATVGFASLDYGNGTDLEGNSVESPEYFDYDGLILRADVTKSFSRYSKLIFGAERRPNFSAFSTNRWDSGQANAYYVSNRAAFTFTNQPQGARVGWTLAGAFQRNTYDSPTVDEASGEVKEREDDITYLRAEVGFHPLEHLSFRLNYRWEERDSNHQQYDYEDNLFILQVQFGF